MPAVAVSAAQSENPFGALAEQMLAREEGRQPEAEVKQEAKPEAPAEAPKEEPKEAAPEEQPEAKEPPKEEPKVEAPKYKLKLNYKGEDREVEEEEARELAQKGYDYTQKMQALSKQRETFEAESKQNLAAKLKEYEDKLQVAEAAIWNTLAPEIQTTDWTKLAQENPAEWAARYQRVQNIQGQLQKVREEGQRIATARQQEAQESLKKQVSETLETLPQKIPGWNNELYSKILRAGTDIYGFKQEEVGAITDHRAIEVLHDAMQYRALKAKPIGDKKVAEKPKAVLKPGVGTEEKVPQAASAERLKELSAQQKKSGSRNDTAALFAHMFETGRL